MNAVSSQRQGFKRRAGLPREQDREATQEHNGPVEGQGLSAPVACTSSTVVQWHKRCSTAAALTAVASSGAVCRPTNTMAHHDTTAANSLHDQDDDRRRSSSMAGSPARYQGISGAPLSPPDTPDGSGITRQPGVNPPRRRLAYQGYQGVSAIFACTLTHTRTCARYAFNLLIPLIPLIYTKESEKNTLSRRVSA